MDNTLICYILCSMICFYAVVNAQNAMPDIFTKANRTLQNMNATIEENHKSNTIPDANTVGTDRAVGGPEENTTETSDFPPSASTTDNLDVVSQRKRFSSIKSLFEYKLRTDREFMEPTMEHTALYFSLNMDVELESLVELEDNYDMLSTVLKFSLSWTDTSFTWDTGVVPRANISLPEDRVWTPRIVVVNPQVTQDVGRQMDVKSVVVFSHYGRARWLFTRNIDTKCEVDTTFYPFDTQTCHIQIRFDIYTKLKVNIDNLNFLGDNNNWNVSFYSVDTVKDRDTGQCILDIRLDLDRKPLAVVLNVILPIFILVALSPLVFMLPKEPGDRLGLSLTTLLAVSVYMTMVADTLPKTSDPVPVISIVLFLWYISMSSIVILVLIKTRIARLGDRRKPPIWVRKAAFLSGQLCRLNCVCSKFKYTPDVENDACSKCAPNGTESNVFQNGNGNIKDEEEGTGMDEDQATPSSESHELRPGTHMDISWRHVSTILDRWLVLIIYVFKFIILAVLLIAVLEKEEPERPIVSCIGLENGFDHSMVVRVPISYVNVTTCDVSVPNYQKTSESRLLRCIKEH